LDGRCIELFVLFIRLSSSTCYKHRNLLQHVGSSKTTTSRPFGGQPTSSSACMYSVPGSFFAQVRGRRIIILPTIFRIVSPSPHKVIRWRKRVVCAFGNMRDDKKEIGRAILGFLECWVAQKPPMRRSALLSVG
jgi:hypothetical protein